jgi:hypothetical protein
MLRFGGMSEELNIEPSADLLRMEHSGMRAFVAIAKHWELDVPMRCQVLRNGEPASETSGVWAPFSLVATIAPRMLCWASLAERVIPYLRKSLNNKKAFSEA